MSLPSSVEDKTESPTVAKKGEGGEEAEKTLKQQLQDKVPDQFEDNKVVGGALTAAGGVDKVRDVVPDQMEDMAAAKVKEKTGFCSLL